MYAVHNAVLNSVVGSGGEGEILAVVSSGCLWSSRFSFADAESNSLIPIDTDSERDRCSNNPHGAALYLSYPRIFHRLMTVFLKSQKNSGATLAEASKSPASLAKMNFHSLHPRL